MIKRKSWDEYFLEVAEVVSTRSTCNRLKVGCVIVKDNRIVSTGYNGSVHGLPHCHDVGCLTNEQGRCIRTIHAEENAILHARRDELIGATAYVTHEPCENCTKRLVQAGIKRVVFLNPYKNKYNKEFNNGIEWVNYNKNKKPVLFLISGHGGSGKTTIMREVMKNELISVTTRPMRNGEVNGVDYHFVSEEEYDQMLKEDKLAQKSSNYTYRYGITKNEIEFKLSKGNAFAIVNYEGMKDLKAYYPNAVSLFFYAPYEETKDRLKGRGDNEESIKARMDNYYNELSNKIHYDYVIKNKQGHLLDVIDVVRKIIRLESK
jgi:dCMP deaminase